MAQRNVIGFKPSSAMNQPAKGIPYVVRGISKWVYYSITCLPGMNQALQVISPNQN